jgi:CRISPR type I-E-associated protein CasA/Cse1
LVAVQAFHPGGLLSRDTKNGDPTAAKSGLVCNAAVVSVQADTLFEALVLNLIRYPSDEFPSTSKDAPAWEQPPLDKYKVRPCLGLTDWYTWQSRRIQLLPNAAGDVEHFVLLAGHELSETGVNDPMCAYKIHDKHGRLTVGFNEDRALWRDSAALYQVTRQSNLVAPLVVRQFTSRRSAHQRKLRLRVDGQVPNKASIVLTRSEVLPLPLEIIERPELVGYVRDEISRSETAQGELRNALFRALAKVLSVGDRDPDAKDVRGLIDETRALPRFWADLKDPFDRFIEALPSDPDAAVAQFQSLVRRTALAQYEHAALSSGTPSRVLKGYVLGRQTLLFGLAKCGLGVRELAQRNQDNTSEATL